MKTGNADVKFTDGQFAMFRNYLYELTGVWFDEGKRFILQNRVLRRMKAAGTDRPIEYLTMLKRQPGNVLDSELYRFIDSVTIHETYFFRSSPQLEGFELHVLRELVERQRSRGDYTLNVWSAGCSSGDEPYTLAIILRELLGEEFSRWTITIVGTDISHRVIQRARTGLYDEQELRNVPPEYLARYFTAEGSGHYQLAAEISNMVSFRVLNFQNDLGMEAIHGQHVIFCRNTLIYIGPDARQRFVTHFERSLTDGGCLVIGPTESLSGVATALELESHPGVIVYRRKEPR